MSFTGPYHLTTSRLSRFYVGPHKTIQTAHRMSITSNIRAEIARISSSIVVYIVSSSPRQYQQLRRLCWCGHYFILSDVVSFPHITNTVYTHIIITYDDIKMVIVLHRYDTYIQLISCIRKFINSWCSLYVCSVYAISKMECLASSN